MKVKPIITPKDIILTVQAADSLKRAEEVFTETKTQSIPVLEGNKFKGILFKTSLLEALEHPSESTKTAGDILVSGAAPLSENDDIDVAVARFSQCRVPFITVADSSGSFSGIVTHTAVFNVLSDAFGTDRGEKICIYAYNIPGQISKISKIIAKFKVNILGFVMFNPNVMTNVTVIIVRVEPSKNMKELLNALKKAGFDIR